MSLTAGQTLSLSDLEQVTSRRPGPCTAVTAGVTVQSLHFRPGHGHDHSDLPGDRINCRDWPGRLLGPSMSRGLRLTLSLIDAPGHWHGVQDQIKLENSESNLSSFK